MPVQGGESDLRRPRSGKASPMKPRSDVNRPSCSRVWGSGGRWFESSHPDQFSLWGNTGVTAGRPLGPESCGLLSSPILSFLPAGHPKGESNPNPQIKRTTDSRPPLSTRCFRFGIPERSLLDRPPVSACGHPLVCQPCDRVLGGAARETLRRIVEARKPTGLVCPQCRKPVGVIENRLPRTLVFWCSACEN